MKILGLLSIIVLALIVTIGIGGFTAEASVVPDWDGAPNPIPQWYYALPCQQPDGTSLHSWLGSLQWYGELEAGGWDCSQLSAYIEWMAENCGHDAVFTCRRGTSESSGHCWLTIGGMSYEATGLYWIDLNTADQAYYAADIWFQDIYEAWEYTPSNKAWGWWITYPELVTRGEQ